MVLQQVDIHMQENEFRQRPYLSQKLTQKDHRLKYKMKNHKTQKTT